MNTQTKKLYVVTQQCSETNQNLFKGMYGSEQEALSFINKQLRPQEYKINGHDVIGAFKETIGGAQDGLIEQIV